MNIHQKFEEFCMEKNKHYFYVLECGDGSYYGGYTIDIERRVKQHNEGKGARYTRSHRPVELLYSEEFETKTEAMRAEYHFKQLTRKEKEQYVQKGE